MIKLLMRLDGVERVQITTADGVRRTASPRAGGMADGGGGVAVRPLPTIAPMDWREKFLSQKEAL
jgi:hypothetical protein